jgi:hypothetical protein
MGRRTNGVVETLMANNAWLLRSTLTNRTSGCANGEQRVAASLAMIGTRTRSVQCRPPKPRSSWWRMRLRGPTSPSFLCPWEGPRIRIWVGWLANWTLVPLPLEQRVSSIHLSWSRIQIEHLWGREGASWPLLGLLWPCMKPKGSCHGSLYVLGEVSLLGVMASATNWTYMHDLYQILSSRSLNISVPLLDKTLDL